MDGAGLAARLREEVKQEIAELGHVGLATVLVGDDPASDVYIRLKHKASDAAGIAAVDYRLPADTTEDELVELVAKLNVDDSVDGILVQTPLPEQIDEARIMRAIDPMKDVDGLHPFSAGQLYLGRQTLVPATPLGATVIDVGITRTEAGLVGDVEADVAEVAAFLTPVPGGVGPMTIAALLGNAVRAARYRRGQLAFPLI